MIINRLSMRWFIISFIFLFYCVIAEANKEALNKIEVIRKDGSSVIKSCPLDGKINDNSCIKSNIRIGYSKNLSVLLLRGGASTLPKSTSTINTVKRIHDDENTNNVNDDIQLVRGGETKSNLRESSPISKIFPIALNEIPQFMSMSIMMFLFIYVFTTVRDTKDTLVVSNCGAEAIPFLKLYGVMPSAFLFIVGYSKLSNLLGKEALFYTTLVPFFVFYTVFAFVLFPNRDSLHLIGNAIGEEATPSVAGAAMSLIKYWSFSLYFIVSELWASAGVPLLFWQCANDVTSLSQAKRFYPLFAVTGNLAPIISGKVMSYIVSLQKTTDDIGFGSTLKKLAIIKLSICFGIIALYNAIYAMSNRQAKKVAADATMSKIKQIQQSKKIEVTINVNSKMKKKKPTLGESMKELSKSKELRSMAIMVICYNTCIELTEVLWKGLLRKSLPNKSSYMSYMASFSQKVGMISFVLQFCASEIINGLGWKFAALLTPLTMAILAVPFFTNVSLGEEKGFPLATALAIGTWQNIASKVTKYSLFDPCKEMAYIPLGPEAKVKGKAAVDVMGARLGRSIGSASQQLLVLLIGGGSILNCAPMLGLLYGTTVGFWINAVSVLGKLFDSSSNKEGDDTITVGAIGKGSARAKITAKVK